jgi:hypothetical protein
MTHFAKRLAIYALDWQLDWMLASSELMAALIMAMLVGFWHFH